VAPPGNQAANREHKLRPKRRQGPGLLSEIGANQRVLRPRTDPDFDPDPDPDFDFDFDFDLERLRSCCAEKT
jgi:hypothetical protein